MNLITFIHNHAKDTNEDSQYQSYWIDFGLAMNLPERFSFKRPPVDGSWKEYDAKYTNSVLIEHKSADVSLKEGSKSLKKVLDQAMGYVHLTPAEKRPRFVILCNFKEWIIYQLNLVGIENQTRFKHEDLKKVNVQQILDTVFKNKVEKLEERVADRQATRLIANVHKVLFDNNYTGEELEILMTRLVFCFFADKTGIFALNQFAEFLKDTDIQAKQLGGQLNELFETLDTKPHERQKSGAYNAFPYVNGKLFEKRIKTVRFSTELRESLIKCSEMDWSGISPAIFGQMFQGVIGEEYRHDVGAHYTSERNIEKAINPLFMDELYKRFGECNNSKNALMDLQNDMAAMTFFDPACGCGNFLVTTYRNLRKLELEILKALYPDGKGILDIETQVKISIDQFYGLDIEKSAVEIAKVALWITDHQMNLETAEALGVSRPTIPLSKSATTLVADSLTHDWEKFLPASECAYIIGNPPFLGAKNLSGSQRASLAVANKALNNNNLDFVSGWFTKAVQYMCANKEIKASLVSTNSIAQGEQVAPIFGYMEAMGAKINFAHQTFKWTNEGVNQAAVHCIITGFSFTESQTKVLFKCDDSFEVVDSINGYLNAGPSVYAEKRNDQISNELEMTFGSQPIDNGNLILSEIEKDGMLQIAPEASQLIRPFLGADELLNGRSRWCLWLKDAKKPFTHIKPIMNRVRACTLYRAKSSKPDVPGALFGTERHQNGKKLLIPLTSSELRDYIPMAFDETNGIASNSFAVLSNATSYHFGVLTSSMHMAWMRMTAGRLKSDYRYSNTLVYNTFVYPEEITETRKREIAKTANEILKVRAQYSNWTLAQLYNRDTMPAELLQAHKANNATVDKAYGYRGKNDDAGRQAFMLKLYQKYSLI